LNTGEPGGPAGTQQLGLLLVQVLDARRLRVEVRANDRSGAAPFGAGASLYVR